MLSFMYPWPESMLVSAIAVTSFIGLTCTGIFEVKGKHLNYSKFWNATPPSVVTKFRLSSKLGMFLLYLPSVVAAVVALSFPAILGDQRCLSVSLALGLHFLKRDLEVLFIHKFSGNIMLDSIVLISFSYCLNTVFIIYAQFLAREIPEPAVDLWFAGLVLFIVGMAGNFYHHYLLSKLRKEGEKEYKIPKGGLFDLVICPHYLFEIIDLFGISFMSQTVHGFAFALSSTFYLAGRSYATRRWYLSKFKNFPKHVKALIPFIF